MPKKIAQDIARQVKQLGEEVIKEFKDLPGGIAREVGEQIRVLPRGWGEKKGESPLSTRLIQEKREEEERDLAFARRRIKELTPKPREPGPEVLEEETERQRELAEEAERTRPLEEPETKKPRGLPIGAKRRIEKSMPELVGRRVGG